MRFIFSISLLFILFTSNSLLFSQDIPKDEDIYDSVLYSKEISGGVIFHNLGWGAEFRKGKNITVFKKRLFEFDFVGMKSPKQIKTYNIYFINAKRYVYGKLNYVYILRGGIGLQKLLNRKPYWGGVELRYFYYGGVSLGFAKPVYLYILNFTSSIYEYEITTEKYDPEKHFYDNIYGRAPFTKGLEQTKLYPGIYAKFGVNFEFGIFKSKISALEIGTVIDFFPKAIPIMAFNKSKNLFVTIYLSINFGKRYN